MSAVTYVGYVDGFRGRVPAAVAYEELERVRAQCGGDLTAGDVYDAAQAPGSPLRPQIFDMAEADAAREHYLNNCRCLLRSVVVRYAGVETPQPVKVFVTVGNPANGGGRRYSSLTEALQSPQRREYVLAQALTDLAALRRKYAMLSELTVVWNSVDTIAV